VTRGPDRAREAAARAGRLILMAAIIGTLLYFPAAIAVALVCAAASVRAESLLTFGGSLGLVAGILAWWLVGVAIALPYAAFVFPWHDNPE
jgi:succinate-acetate transporter protein